jgi:catechol 2,3-dioxygenase-like lactoylglutathione lyase family enzyme
MPLHRMNQITIGVPDVEKTSEFYRDFGLGWSRLLLARTTRTTSTASRRRCQR